MLPPPLASAKVFPARPLPCSVGQSRPSSADLQFSGPPKSSSAAYVKEFAFPSGPSSTQGVVWGGNLVAKDVASQDACGPAACSEEVRCD